MKALAKVPGGPRPASRTWWPGLVVTALACLAIAGRAGLAQMVRDLSTRSSRLDIQLLLARQFLGIGLAGMLLGGCYRSHTLPGPAPSDAGRAPDAGWTPDAGEAPDAGPISCSWEVTAHAPVTEPVDNEALDDVWSWDGTRWQRLDEPGVR